MNVNTAGVGAKGLREALSNLLLALLYAVFVYAFLANFLEHRRITSLLFVGVESVFIYLALARRCAREVSASSGAWFFAFAGTFMPLLLRPTAGAESWPGELVQGAGVLLTGASILSLGRSFGIVAANRGVVTGGLYRHVRHPLYLSYTVGAAGFLLNNATAFNIIAAALGLAAQLVRIRYEEGLLGGDPAYRDYARRTRWRLVPWVY